MLIGPKIKSPPSGTIQKLRNALILIDKRGNFLNIELFEKSSFFPSLPPGDAYPPLGDSHTLLSATEKAKPQPGLTPDWGFLVALSLLPLRSKR